MNTSRTFLLLAWLLGGCDRPVEPASPADRPPQAAAAKSTSSTEDPQIISASSASPALTTRSTDVAPPRPSSVGWDVPKSWQSVESPSKMRKATYRIPRAEGDPADGEMSVTQVGGSVEANLARWKEQFDPAESFDRSARVVNGIEVVVASIRGTYKGGGMPGMAPAEPQKGYALAAAIVMTAPLPNFFKLTGPEKTVANAKSDFEALVASLRAE